jgi:hypothetical protein
VTLPGVEEVGRGRSERGGEDGSAAHVGEYPCLLCGETGAPGSGSDQRTLALRHRTHESGTGGNGGGWGSGGPGGTMGSPGPGGCGVGGGPGGVGMGGGAGGSGSPKRIGRREHATRRCRAPCPCPTSSTAGRARDTRFVSVRGRISVT